MVFWREIFSFGMYIWVKNFSLFASRSRTKQFGLFFLVIEAGAFAKSMQHNKDTIKTIETIENI